jgi:ubiquinone/menaquinone biosynthesis C-methylase UbiE
MEKGYDFIRRSLKRLTKKSDWILEVGCGPAWYKDSVNGRYVGLDLKAEPYRSDLPVQVDISGDGMSLPFKDEVFHIVIFVASLYQMAKVEKALEEAFRVLKQDGSILVFDYNKKTHAVLEMKEKFKRFCWNSKDLVNCLGKFGFTLIERHLPFELRSERELLKVFFKAFEPLLIPFYEFHQGWNIAFAKK